MVQRNVNIDNDDREDIQEAREDRQEDRQDFVEDEAEKQRDDDDDDDLPPASIETAQSGHGPERERPRTAAAPTYEFGATRA